MPCMSIKKGGVLLSICIVVFLLILAGRASALAEATGKGGSNAQAVQELGYDGSGIGIGLLCSSGARASHEAFFDKDESGNPVGSTHLFNHDYSGDGLGGNLHHDTWMAGIAAGRGGVEHPNDIGVAPGADVHTARIVNNTYLADPVWLDEALLDLITNYNCRVFTSGIALAPTPNGMSTYSLLIDYYAYAYDVVMAMPAGNSDTCVNVFGDAYNCLTTGGLLADAQDNYNRVGLKSGQGPTSDGRNKPELVAPAQKQIVPGASNDFNWVSSTSTYFVSQNGETSLSAPHTAGTAALLLDYAYTSAEPHDHHNQVIRAVMTATTFPNVNDKQGNVTTGEIFHPQRGYGRVNAGHSFDILSSPRVGKQTSVSGKKGWSYEHIYRSQTHSYFIPIQDKQRLILALAWNRRVQRSGQTFTTGLADLEFQLYAAGNPFPLYVKKVTGNNLLKIDLQFLQDKTYIIKIINRSYTEETDYGMAFYIADYLKGDFAPASYVVNLDDMSYMWRYWLCAPPDDAIDLCPDSTIDFKDYSSFVANWLAYDPAYYTPE